MASASAPASDDCKFPPGAPAVIQWPDGDDSTRCIGTKPTHPVSAFIVTHVSNGTAFFSLRTVVGLKEGGKNRTTFHVFIYPEHVRQLTLRDHGSHPTPMLNALMKRMLEYNSPKDVIGLTFSLQKPSTVIGPSNLTALSPKTKPSEDFLVSLNSLVQATEVTMFIPKNNNHVGSIKSLCSQVCNGGLKASPDAYSLPRLYGGSGGKDVRDLLSRFHEPTEGPPSYDELALSSPGPPPQLRTGRRKRLSSTRGSPSPPPSKRQTGDPPVSAAEVQLMKQELARLTAEVAQLRGDACSQEGAPPPPPPRSPNTEDRLQRVESAVSRFDERMQRVERALEQAGLLVLTGGRVPGEGMGDDDNLPTALVVDRDQTLLDTFGQRLDDLAADIDADVDGKLDEMLSDVKDEVRDWAQEAYQELLETRLGEMVDEHLADAAWTVRRCD